MAKAFPQNARLNRVMGILNILSCNAGKLGMSRLSSLSRTHVDMLLPQVNAARMLGLIQLKGSEVILTDLGSKLCRSGAGATQAIKGRLTRLEPFKSAMALTKGSRGFTTEELSDVLEAGKLYWSTKAKDNAGIINSMLVQWAIHFCLLEYDGRSRMWVGS